MGHHNAREADPGRVQLRGVRPGIEWVGVGQDEALCPGGQGKLRDGACPGVARLSRPRLHPIWEGALVDQEIDAAHELGVVERGGGIGHVGQGAVGPVETIGQRSSRVGQEARGDPRAGDLHAFLGHRGDGIGQRQGKEGCLEKAMAQILHSGGPVDRDRFNRFLPKHIQKVGQPVNMIQMKVREENGQRGRAQVLAHAEEARARVENDPHLGDHHAARVPRLVRVIARRAQEDHFHPLASRGLAHRAEAPPREFALMEWRSIPAKRQPELRPLSPALFRHVMVRTMRTPLSAIW